MNKETLEMHLENGHTLGFNKKTDSPDTLGWILLWKLKPDKRYLALLKENEDPYFTKKQKTISEKPYQISVLELSREIYESGKYETDDDYTKKQIFRFANLEEMELFLKSFELSLENIKWRSEINAP